MKLDTRVHTVYSGDSTIRPLSRIVRESYNSVERVYRRGITSPWRATSDAWVGALYVDRTQSLIASPAGWRRRAMLAAGVLALPFVLVPLVVAAGRFILEQRFNRDLLLDLIARPAVRAQEAA